MFLLHDFTSLGQMGSARRGTAAYDGVTDGFIFSVVLLPSPKDMFTDIKF